MKMLYLNKKFNYLNLHLSLKFSSLFYLLKNINNVYIVYFFIFNHKIIKVKNYNYLNIADIDCK